MFILLTPVPTLEIAPNLEEVIFGTMFDEMFLAISVPHERHFVLNFHLYWTLMLLLGSNLKLPTK